MSTRPEIQPLVAWNPQLVKDYPAIHGAEIIEVPQMASLDVDGLQSNTVKLVQRADISATATIGTEAGHLYREYQTKRATGSFAVVPYVENLLQEKGASKEEIIEHVGIFIGHFVHKQPDGIDNMYEDARRLVNRMQPNEPLELPTPHFSNTYGDRLWQMPKVLLIGNQSFTIADTMDKTPPMKAIQAEDDNFYTYDPYSNSVYKAGSIVHFDDKAKAFETLPQNDRYSGVLVYRLQPGQTVEDLPERQRGNVPPNVSVASSLDQTYQNSQGLWIVDQSRTQEDAEQEQPSQFMQSIYLPINHAIEIVYPADNQLQPRSDAPSVEFRIAA